MSYYPRRPVTSFQDLEVYQKLLAIAVVVVKHVPPDASNPVVQQLHTIVLSLPVRVGQAHSLRFSHTATAIETLEEILLGCNQTIVLLELYRDLFEKKNAEAVESKTNSQSDGQTSNSTDNGADNVSEKMPDIPRVDRASHQNSRARSDENTRGSQTAEFYEDLIKTITATRFKVLHLQRSWQKFTPQAPPTPT